eukprot:SAG31_NODE_577_length_13952_cov_2.717121_4_plen_67_part_00
MPRQYAAARSTSAVSEQEATVKRLEQSPARRDKAILIYQGKNCLFAETISDLCIRARGKLELCSSY